MQCAAVISTFGETSVAVQLPMVAPPVVGVTVFSWNTAGSPLSVVPPTIAAPCASACSTGAAHAATSTTTATRLARPTVRVVFDMGVSSATRPR